MDKEFVLYEQAIQLKDLGFDEPCSSLYLVKDVLGLGIPGDFKILDYYAINSKFTVDTLITRPTYSQAFRFFLEKYNLFGFVDTGFCPFKNEPKSKTGWVGIVKGVNERGLSSSTNFFKPISTNCFKDIDDSKEACLDLLIEIAKR